MPKKKIIPDLNHNGILDGSEIIAQLKIEDKFGDGPIHYVLRSAMESHLKDSLHTVTANELNHEIKNLIQQYKASVPLNSIKYTTMDLSEIIKYSTLHEFARSFLHNFEKGKISIQSKDLPEIINHLGELAAPTTPDKSPQAKRVIKK